MWEEWKRRFQLIIEASKKSNCKRSKLNIEPPATMKQIESVENSLGKALPKSFRKVLVEFSSKVDVWWSLPDDKILPSSLRGIFCGNCEWNILELIALEEGRKGWVEDCFPNPDDSYHSVWHNKLAFHGVMNGDMLALDLNVLDDSPVVYLSHDGADFHGTILGNNFIDFIDRWSLLAFVGSEFWQLEKFIAPSTIGLDPFCDNAIKWRDWFSLKINS